jgi:hypothetical protein
MLMAWDRSKCATDGKWLSEESGIWQRSDGRLYFTADYLEGTYPAKNKCSWLSLVGRTCPSFDPNINGGVIHSELVLTKRGFPVRVFWQKDAEQLIEREKSPEARKIDPAGNGKWIADGVFLLARDLQERHLFAGEVLYTDEKIVEEYGVARDQPGDWRRQPQTALDQNGNEGKLRHWWTATPDLSAKGGQRPVILSARKDVDAVIASLKAVPASEPVRGIKPTEVARRLRINMKRRQDAILFSYALIRFREEEPKWAWQEPYRDSGKHLIRRPWRYDFDKLTEWLGDRSILEVGAERQKVATPESIARRASQLRRDMLFLIFVLTRGNYTPNAFSQFVSRRPTGPLGPGDPVPLAVLHRLAKAAKLSRRRLQAARRKLPIVVCRMHSGRTSYWRLTAAVKAPALTLSRAACNSPAVQPKAAEAPMDAKVGTQSKGRGRPRRAGTERVMEFCFEGYNRGDKLAVIRRGASKEFGSAAPKEDSHVTEYAKRYAKRTGKQLTRRGSESP